MNGNYYYDTLAVTSAGDRIEVHTKCETFDQWMKEAKKMLEENGYAEVSPIKCFKYYLDISIKNKK